MNPALLERLHDLATSANPELRRQAYAFALDLDLPEIRPHWREIDEDCWIHASAMSVTVEGYETGVTGEPFPSVLFCGVSPAGENFEEAAESLAEAAWSCTPYEELVTYPEALWLSEDAYRSAAMIHEANENYARQSMT